MQLPRKAHHVETSADPLVLRTTTSPACTSLDQSVHGDSGESDHARYLSVMQVIVARP